MGYEDILFIGPNYKNHTGGIGAVLEVYSKNIKPFNFCPSFDGNYNALGKMVFFGLCLFRVFFKLLTVPQIKIVHIHGSTKGSFYRKYLLFLMAKYIFGKKVAYHMHGGSFDRFYERSNKAQRRFIEHFVNKADALICLSNSWEAYFKSHFNAKRLLVLNNPIEQNKNIKIEKIITVEFLFLGKICDAKGVFDLLEVIRDNRELYKQKAKFRFGGNGETIRLESFIKENQLSSFVFFEGWVSGLKKHQLLLEANVYLLPSYIEGLPMSILEAMNYCLPVISTNIGGIPEILATDVNGFLIEPGDKSALKRGIDHFIDSPSDILKMGHRGKVRSTAFDIQSILPKLNALYESL